MNAAASDVRSVVNSERLAAALVEIDSAPITARTKGFPMDRAPMSAKAMVGLNLNILRQELPFPVCIARASSISANRAWMAAFLSKNHVALAPHAKTTMSPHLLAMQIEDGAWGFCVATAQQAATLRSFGIRRLLIANQLVGHANVDFIFSELERDPELEIYALVDSKAGLARLLERAERYPRAAALRLLLEVGADGGRTGCRTVQGALELAEAITRSGSKVVLSGIEAYESVFPGAALPARLALIESLLSRVLEVATACSDRGWFHREPVILSAGGSEYFDRVAARLREWEGSSKTIVVLRSGCYIAHDDLAYARAFDLLCARSPSLAPRVAPLQPALEVWGVVQSTPESGLALVTVGKRDVSFDFEMPVPKLWYRGGLHGRPVPLPPGHSITRLNDQHAFLKCTSESPLAVGDLVGLGLSHPCTTFDKWNLISVVDDDYQVVGTLRTFF